MRTVALRFAETFAPDCGTIQAHQELIEQYGFVWYGKMGNTLSAETIKSIMDQADKKIILIRSGKPDRYWAHISAIQKEQPPIEFIPSYYRGNAEKFKVWFKVISFEPAARNVLSKCFVVSSGNSLGKVSMHSMNPYFIIDYKEDQE